MGVRTQVVTRQASAIEDLKTVAISRLVLDNFSHIKAYWVTMGEESASVALHCGADDLDGTIGEEKIEAEAGQILLGPANVPHKFENLGPGVLETTDIHLSPEWIQTNLEDPELAGKRQA